MDLESYKHLLKISDNCIFLKNNHAYENDNQKINICGGLSIFKKEAIDKIGGWNEEFWSWGGEDDYLTMVVKKYLTYKEMDHRCYHLYHEREAPDNTQYQKTLKLLNRLVKLSDQELNRYISSNKSKNSMLNKCDI